MTSLSGRMRLEGVPSFRKIDVINVTTDQLPPVSFKSKTQIAAENSVKSRNLGARLSSTPSSAGLFIDRTQTIKPSSCCVRCSFYASICMECCDLQTQKAVAFYRRTLGKGASAILSQAIMEAGLGRMSKLVIFSLWKNGTATRTFLRERKIVEVVQQHDMKMMKAPLLAWRKFTVDELMSRKIAKMTTMELKVQQLESQVELLNAQKIEADQEVGRLNDRLVYSVLINDDYVETIRVLKSDLANEKKRVLMLAQLCEPVRELSTVLESYGQSECDSFVDVLVDSGCQIYTYDYGTVFNQASRDVMLNLMTLREERKVNPSSKTRFIFKLESEATVKMLIQWVNFISRECVNSIDEPTDDDDNFETSLPRHEQIYDINQLCTGRTLSRVIFYLIYCGSHMAKKSILPANKADIVIESKQENIKTRKHSLANSKTKKYDVHPLHIVNHQKKNTLKFYKNHISSLKAVEDEPEQLLELALKYAGEFLAIPLYNTQDILGGKKPEMISLLGHLMVSSSPTKQEKDLEATRSLLLEYDDLNTTLTDLHSRLVYSTRTVKEIKEALVEYFIPVETVEESSIPVTPVNVSKDNIVVRIELLNEIQSSGVSIDGINDDNDAQSDTVLEGNTEGLLEAEKEPEVYIDHEAIKYAKLQNVIDRLVNSSDVSLLTDSISAMGTNVDRITAMRSQIASEQKKKNECIRIATDVRSFISKNVIQSLVAPLGMITVET